MITVSGEADGGALWPISVCAIHTGVAALILDGDRLDGEPTVRQRGAQPHSPLVRGLYHGVTLLGKRGHFCGGSLLGFVSPSDLLDLFRQPIETGEGGFLSPHGCLVAVGCDLCWRQNEATTQERIRWKRRARMQRAEKLDGLYSVT